jgi:hypothetical protein
MAVATRRPLLRRCSFILLVVLGIETADAASNRVAGRRPDLSKPLPILASQNPRGDGEVEVITGEEAMKIFEERVVAKYPDAWKASLKTKAERGWTETSNVIVIRTRPRIALTRAQSQSFNIGDGVLIERQWNCATNSVCGTYSYESFYYGSTIVYDAQFVPTGGSTGYSPWASYVAGNPGRDLRRQRQAMAGASDPVRLVGVGASQDAPCPGALWEWRQCMRNCLQQRHGTAVSRTGYAGGATLVACLGKMRAGTLWIAGLSYLGCVISGAGMGALVSFGTAFGNDPCDGTGQCGPRQC